MDKIIAIYGPTTSNKLGLALNLSKYIWGKYQIEPEVVNVDSRKIYQGFLISQSLPQESFLKKVKTHLFGTVSPIKKLDLYEFQEIVMVKISEIQERGNLPILLGNSSLHLLTILQNWQKGEKSVTKELPTNVLVFGVSVAKPTLKKAVEASVIRMFKEGLGKEFQRLYKKSQDKELAEELLEETLGYREFLEMARILKKSPENLGTKDFPKIKKWIIKDILNYAYHQTLSYKKFPGLKFVGDFNQARRIFDSFIFPQRPGPRKYKD